MSRTHSGRTGALAMLLGSALTISGMAIGTANAQTPAPAAPAAAAPAPPAKQKLAVTGLVDGYYAYLFSNPKGVGSGEVSGTPDYTYRTATPTLSLAELNLTYAPLASGGFGAKATLVTGDTADIDVGAFPGGYGSTSREARYKNIQQLYVTWAFPKGGGVDFGKFVTPFGYEVIESNANYNYTRSIPYSDLVPVTHTGFRVTSPLIAKGLTVTGYLVNSLNNTASEGVSDDNNSQGYIGSLNWTDPAGKYVFVETLGYSKDKAVYTPFGTNSGNLTGNDGTTLSDTDLTWNLDAKDIIGGDYTYRLDDIAGGKVTSNGYAVYYRRQLTAPTAVALRYSGDTTTQPLALGTPHSIEPQEFTATYEMKSGASWLTRLEYRHDMANIPYFVDGSGNTTKKSQDMAVISAVYTFGP